MMILNYLFLQVCLLEKKIIIPFKKLESFSKHDNYFQRKVDICDYRFDYHANILKTLIVVSNLDSKYFRELENLLEYN